MTRRLVLVLLFAASAFAQAPSTFKEGVLAFEKQEWAKAEQLMRETVARNPNESEGTVSIAGACSGTTSRRNVARSRSRSTSRTGSAISGGGCSSSTESAGCCPSKPAALRRAMPWSP